MGPIPGQAVGNGHNPEVTLLPSTESLQVCYRPVILLENQGEENAQSEWLSILYAGCLVNSIRQGCADVPIYYFLSPHYLLKTLTSTPPLFTLDYIKGSFCGASFHIYPFSFTGRFSNSLFILLLLTVVLITVSRTQKLLSKYLLKK